MTWDQKKKKKEKRALLERQIKLPITTVPEELFFSERNEKHHLKAFLQLYSKKGASKQAVVIITGVDPATGP